MTSSGTYAYSPANDDLVIDAFERIQIRKPAITVDHLKSAARQANLLLAQWASGPQPLLWKTETQTLTCVQGTATYTPAARTVAILSATIQTGSGQTLINRNIGPLSTTDYASIPNPNLQSPPTSFWFNRLIAPQVTLYPTPDDGGPYTLVLTTASQVQDVGLTNGQTLDVPYRFLDAFAAGLAHRLARIYAQPLEAARKQDAMEAWQIAFGNDVEDVPLMLAPSLSGYYR